MFHSVEEGSFSTSQRTGEATRRNENDDRVVGSQKQKDAKLPFCFLSAEKSNYEFTPINDEDENQHVKQGESKGNFAEVHSKDDYDSIHISTASLQPKMPLNMSKALRKVPSFTFYEPFDNSFGINDTTSNQATKRGMSAEDDDLFIQTFGQGSVIHPLPAFKCDESQNGEYTLDPFPEQPITLVDMESCHNGDKVFFDNNFTESAFKPIPVLVPPPDAEEPENGVQLKNKMSECTDSISIHTNIDEMAQEPPRKKQKNYCSQSDKWQKRYIELVDFEKEHKHCLVPHDFTSNIELSRWVKRQRYQYNLFQRQEKSSITKERIKLLENIGFVWDAQEANWQERFKELVDYKAFHGNCDVNTKSNIYVKLGTWVRCQRRQFQLFTDGLRSNMTLERISKLEKLGFNWKIRNLQRPKSI